MTPEEIGIFILMLMLCVFTYVTNDHIDTVCDQILEELRKDKKP